MTEVTFHSLCEIPDNYLKFAVISARYKNKWVFCRHKKRSTWEIPGGHREPEEAISATAHRELWEETGAIDAEIQPMTVYAVTKDGKTTYGMLFFAVITHIGPLADSVEIGEINLSDGLPSLLTYPDIQPHLYRYAEEHYARL